MNVGQESRMTHRYQTFGPVDCFKSNLNVLFSSSKTTKKHTMHIKTHRYKHFHQQRFLEADPALSTD